MADIKNQYDNYVRFVLKADNNLESLTMNYEPSGWNEDQINLDRHEDYHGIFYSFTNDLAFLKDAKEYILTAYQSGGKNTILRLRKDVKKDVDGEVKWVYKYIALADWDTMVQKDNAVSLKFNSNALAEIIKSHETDSFELEREDSIDGETLENLATNNIEIKGREILDAGESKIDQEPLSDSTLIGDGTPKTEIVTRGGDDLSRHSSVQKTSTTDGYEASNMFFVDSVDIEDEKILNIRYDVTALPYYHITLPEQNLKVYVKRFKRNPGDDYTENGSWLLYDATEPSEFKFSGELEVTVQWDEGLMFYYDTSSLVFITKQQIILNLNTFYDSSPSLKFVFLHDAMERLTYILTGRQNAFYSKYFGRTELGYAEDGEGGLIGLMSGLWARNFQKGTEKYKSLTTSTKDISESAKAVFNIGIGIETVDFKERLRFEDLRYYYQNEVVVSFPIQVGDVVRKVDADLFFSGMTFGYEKGGDYEDSMGLDEPNTSTEYVTPIRNSTNKFIKQSKLRTDEYGLELARRKPQSEYPTEDTRYDESNWMLDCKRTEGTNYAQMESEDRLQELPSGIYSPETFRSMFFTPVQMLKRHAWVFRAGMEHYLDKFIKYISSKSNSTLTTWMIGEDRPYSENGDIQLSELDRSRFLPEIIECTHPIDEDLMDWITGTTKVFYKGSWEEIPNYYFKMEIINEKGQYEKVYLLNLKAGSNGSLVFQKSNENILNQN